MNNCLLSSRPQLAFLVSLFLQTICFSLTFGQEIFIDNLRSLESSDSGITKSYSPLQQSSGQLSGLSVFGWIRIQSNMEFGDIFILSSSKTQFNVESTEKIDSNLIFDLSFLNWTDPKLRISSFQDGEDVVSLINLSVEEIDHSWIFVYLGHSFIDSQQIYYKYSFSCSQKELVTKGIISIEPSQFYQLSAGIGQYHGRQYFIGDIVRLTIAFGNQAVREKNFQELHVWFPEKVPICTVVFTECAYTGEATDLCDRSSKKRTKSVLMRDEEEQVYMCLGNKQIKIKRNVECIGEDNWEVLEQQGVIKVESFENNRCDI